MRQVNFPWVPLDESLQWSSFRRAVEILQRRGNSVFVLVGPFNEHMLRQESLEAYQERKHSVEAWLEQQRIPHFVPAALPSKHYADASHPLADGYRLLAGQMLENQSFREFLAK